MTVIITGPGLCDELPALEKICHDHDLRIKVSKGPGGTTGRPKRQVDVQKVVDALTRHGTVRGAARELGLPPGTVWNYLDRQGLLPRQTKNPRHQSSSPS